MKKRSGIDGKGVSEVYATVILVCVTLVMITATVFLAQLNLTTQTEITEFENAKASMISLAQVVEGLGSSKGAAAYTRFAIRSGGLALTPGKEQLTIRVEDQTILTDTVNLIRLKGGGGVSSPYFQILKGDTGINDKDELTNQYQYLIISPENPGDLGLVYLEWNRGPWVIIDFSRVRIVPSGVILYTTDGMNWDPLNVVEVTYVNITFGEFSGSDVYDVCAKVVNVTTRVIPFLDSTSITIRVERESVAQEYLSDQGGNGTLLFLNIVEVEISVR